MQTSFPAFKEWNAIVEALGHGEQIIILRKGGIAEGRGGFQLNTDRFWLYPTFFHAQREKSKPAAQKWFDALNTAPTPTPNDPVELRYFAKVEQAVFLGDWNRVQSLDPHHLWTESLVRERFDWAKPPGLHVILVRVYKVNTPLSLQPTPEMAGCKSWVEVPFSFDTCPSEPVMNEADFSAAKTRLGPL